MKQTQGRDDKGRFLPTTSPEEARIAELEAKVSQLEISGKWNAAEVERLANVEQKLKRIEEASAPFIEATRKKFGVMPEHCSIYQAAEKWQRAFQSEYDRCEREIQEGNALRTQLSRAEQERNAAKESEKKAHELLSSLTTEVEAQKANTRLAEGRYRALQRQRTGEWLIVMTVFTLAVLPAVFIAGRLWGMR